MITRRTVLKAATGTLSLTALGAFQAAEHSGATSTPAGGAKPRPTPSPKIATEFIQRVLKNEETNPICRIRMSHIMLQGIFSRDVN